MKLIIAAALCALPAFAALGDNAPPIPTTWVQAHPRMYWPSDSWLTTNVWNGGSIPALYSTPATDYDPTCPWPVCNLQNTRYALMAWKASKVAGAPNTALRDKLIQYLDNFPGSAYYGFYFANNVGVGDGSGGVTAVGANFTTGCDGGSCAGARLLVDGFDYTISVVNSATSVTVAKYSGGDLGSVPAEQGLPYPFPTGSGLRLRIVTTPSSRTYGALLYAMVWDVMQPEMNSTQKTNAQNTMANWCTIMENEFVKGSYSPYNDLMYEAGANGWAGLGLFALAPLNYPDAGATGALHLRKMMEILHNRILPAWKHLQGFNEGWNEYVVNNGFFGQKAFILGATLPYAYASGRGLAFYTTDNQWIKQFGYFMMHATRPDWNLETRAMTLRYITEEYSRCNSTGTFGFLDGLAEIYNDPILRGYARQVNLECAAGPVDALRPSTYPWFDPDTPAKTVTAMSSLPNFALFPGVGIAYFHTGHGENDTHVMYSAHGDNFWGHSRLDAGAYSIFNRGLLTGPSGLYVQSSSPHVQFWYQQAIANNTLLFTDSADVYASYTVPVCDFALSNDCKTGGGTYTDAAFPNDGGQRRTGGFQGSKISGVGDINVNLNAPLDYSRWKSKSEYWKYGNIVASINRMPFYAMVTSDLTRSMRRDSIDLAVASHASLPFSNNPWDRKTRAQAHYRTMFFIPRGTAAWMVVIDRAVSMSASQAKKNLIHTVNLPSVSGNTFTANRTELVTATPYTQWPTHFISPYTVRLADAVGSTQYQYNGRLKGWVYVANGTGDLTARTPVVEGGAGREFWIEDPASPGTGINMNHCAFGVAFSDACGGANVWGLGTVEGEVRPINTAAPIDPMSYRLEITPPTAQKADFFVTLYYISSASDTNTIGTPAVSSTGSGATRTHTLGWTDNLGAGVCTYSLVMNAEGNIAVKTYTATGGAGACSNPVN